VEAIFCEETRSDFVGGHTQKDAAEAAEATAILESEIIQPWPQPRPPAALQSSFKALKKMPLDDFAFFSFAKLLKNFFFS
jgi:hypothetical protein